MSDHTQSTAVPRAGTWEDQPAFREVFLAQLPPNHAEQCRQLGDYFYTTVLESQMGHGDLRDLLRGLAADVGTCAAVLRGVHQDFFDCSVPGYPHPVEVWRDRLLSVEAELRAALDAGLGARERAE
jgi:hypothetical protein